MICSLRQLPTGICDRLKQVTFCVTLAQSVRDCELIVYEQRTPESPFLTDEIVQVWGFDVKVIEGVATPTDLEMTPLTRMSLEAVQAFKPLWFRTPDAVFLRQWRMNYQLLVPSVEVRAKISHLNLRNAIGIHCRLGDKVTSEARFVEGLLPCDQQDALDRLAEKAVTYARGVGSDSLFVCCDTLQGKQEMAARLKGSGLRLVQQEIAYDSASLRQTTAQEFAVDLFALSQCTAIFGSVVSGVPRTAAYVGGHQRYHFCNLPESENEWNPRSD